MDGENIAREILALPESEQKSAFDKVDASLRPYVLVWLRTLSGSGGYGAKGFILMAVTDDENGQKDAINYVRSHGLTKSDVAIKRGDGIVSVVCIRDMR